MDLNFVAKWLSYLFFGISGLVHIYFFYLKSYRSCSKNRVDNFQTKDEGYDQLRIISITQGVYDLFLSIQMFVGLYYVNKLQPMIAGPIVSLSGFAMIFSGLILFRISHENRKLALMQFVPPLIGFIFLSVHIIDRIFRNS